MRTERIRETEGYLNECAAARENRRTMKKRTVCLIAALLILFAAVLPAGAETIVICDVTADTADTSICFETNLRYRVAELTAGLDRMPNLQKVDMYGSRMETEDMDMLRERYPQVEFGFTVYMGRHVFRSDITAFSTLVGGDDDPIYYSDAFEMLRFCPNLQALDVGHNMITTLDFLRHFPHMKVLILGKNRITDISELANLQELEYLELFSNAFSDLTPLAGLENLKDLNIAACREVTDLTPLIEGVPNLERFWCGQNEKITEEQRAAMEAAHPDCEFNWVDHPTGGTWRRHPRYIILHHMFLTRIYEPFDQSEETEE